MKKQITNIVIPNSEELSDWIKTEKSKKYDAIAHDIGLEIHNRLQTGEKIQDILEDIRKRYAEQ